MANVNGAFDHINYQKTRIFRLLDCIELKTKVMAHEDSRIASSLKDWQDGKLANSFFIEVLSGYVDDLNSGELI